MSKIEIAKEQYDANNRCVYREWNTGLWEKREYDEKGNLTYIEDSTGYWAKYEYDSRGNRTYFEDSTGYKWGTPRAEVEQEPVICDD